MSFTPLRDLPRTISRAAALDVFELHLITATPTLGGGVRNREPDDLDGVRSAGVRGALRLWWRALAPYDGDSKDLYRRERALWGGLGASPKEVSASRVRVAVLDVHKTELDATDIRIQQSDAYALWTARGTTRDNVPPAPRRRPGMRFTLRVEAPGDVADEVRRTLRAFVLFGGIGARTRRGLGALALAAADRELWLPENLKPTTLTAWLAPAPRRGSPVAALHDALVATGAAGADALASWHTAIGWLRDFRQGANPSQVDAQPTGTWARMRPIVSQGPDGRPGRSRWPEPDKLRQLAGSRSFDHDPLPGHGASPYWPRAEFGLPIEIRFQNKRRDGQFYRPGPPENAMLALRVDGEVQDRLASALLVKPVQLRSGQFVPLALWLTRAIPDAWVGVEDRWSTPKDLKGAASLAGAMPAGDQHHFAPLAGHATVREAFMKWVGARPNVQGGKL